MTAPRFASALAMHWARQLEGLQASLTDEPQAPHAWRWQIRVRVLTYLVSRYGLEPIADSRPHATVDPPPRLGLKRPAPAPSSRGVIRDKLQRISVANELGASEMIELRRELDRRVARQSQAYPRDVLLLLVALAPITGFAVLNTASADATTLWLAAAALLALGALIAVSAKRRTAADSASTAPHDSGLLNP